MGAQLVTVVYASWSHLSDRAFRVLGRMALTALDTPTFATPAGLYFGGRDLLAMSLRQPFPQGHDESCLRQQQQADDPEDGRKGVPRSLRCCARERSRQVSHRTVRHALKELADAGLVERQEQHASRGLRQVWQLHLTKEVSTAPTKEVSTAPTKEVSTAPTKEVSTAPTGRNSEHLLSRSLADLPRSKRNQRGAIGGETEVHQRPAKAAGTAASASHHLHREKIDAHPLGSAARDEAYEQLWKGDGERSPTRVDAGAWQLLNDPQWLSEHQAPQYTQDAI